MHQNSLSERGGCYRYGGADESGGLETGNIDSSSCRNFIGTDFPWRSAGMSLQRKFRGNQKMKLYIDGLKDKYIRSFFTTAQGAAQTPYANKAVRAALDMEDIIWVRSRQVHRDSILAIEQKPETDLILDGYDAFVTDVPGVCLITAHADCIPVQLYDPDRKVIAAVHAGWRGTALGIAAKTAELMKTRYGCGNIRGYIGPGISECCFETDADVPEAMREAFNWADEYISEGRAAGKFYVDLEGINKRQLEEAGVRNIEVSDICTCCNENFCSHRRNPAVNLRMASGICLLA